MESKVIIEQEINNALYIYDNGSQDIRIHEWAGESIYIDIAKLPDLIAALQSFLPKETE